MAENGRIRVENVESLEGDRVRLDIEVSPEAVKEGVEEKVKDLQGKVNIPGFRPGKVPRGILEQRLGKEYIYTEALQDSLPRWYSEAVVESDIRPVDSPQIEPAEGPDEERGFRFAATVEVRPKASLGEYRGMEVPKGEAEVGEEQVDAQVEQLHYQFATLAAVEDRPVQEGDFVILDYSGERMTGGKLEDGEAEDYMLEVGSGEMPEDFESQLVGTSAGERKQFGVTFPMDHEDESLQGQSVLYQVHLKEIKERELPPLDDEFAKEASEFETLGELRDSIRQELEKSIEERVENEFRGQVLDEVAKRAEVNVPDQMVDDKAGEMVESFESSIRQQGIEPEQYYQIAGVSRDDMKDRVRDDAADAVKKELVLDSVAEAEGIEPDQEKIDHEVSHVAEHTGREVGEVMEMMKQNGTYTFLEEEVTRQQALDFLVENAVAVGMPEEEEGEESQEEEE
jgi:trigger factor